MRIKQFLTPSIVAIALLALCVSTTLAQGPLGTAFTYQGRLTSGGTAANGSYDLQFKLFTAASGGAQVGSTQTKDNVNVANGSFVVTLDFGVSAFNGQARYLQIEVRPGASTGAYTTLSPRQLLNATPYSLFSSAPWATNGSNVSVSQGNVGVGTTSPSDKLTVSTATGNYGLVHTDGVAVVGTWVGAGASGGEAGWLGTKTNHPLRFFTNNAGAALSIDTTNNVGIGTISPSALLSVVKSGATEPNVLGTPIGLKVGTPSGTIPLALRQNAAESANPLMASFETSNGGLGYLSANQDAFVVGSAAGKALAFTVNGNKRAVTIANDGAVGIGTNILAAFVQIHSPNPNSDSVAFRVDNYSNDNALSVYKNGTVGFGHPAPATTSHTCWAYVSYNLWFLATCNSAAEYVPTIDGGNGFPETADVVSMAPVTNPYGDEHAPFVVAKSTKPCDENLLGFIVKPESRADGEQKNEHYLPLAIYGYFPAKVTLENGVIQRGDPLTSSSKPGYAMKATDACKIIGYALQDANAEGTIQVFANTGESSAPEVARLRTQMQEKDAQIAELKQQNAALDRRLARLEQIVSGEGGTTTAFNLNWLVVGGGVLAGMVLVYRSRKDK